MTDTMVAKATFTEKPKKTFGDSLNASYSKMDADIARNTKEIKESIDRMLKQLNIGQGSSTPGGNGKDDVRKGMMEAIATSGVLMFIASVVKDIPVVVGIMKMLKLVIMALFLPLIPVLKPVMILLGNFAKFMMTGVNDIGKTLGTIALVVGVIVALAAGIATLPALLIGALAAGAVYLAMAFGQWLRSIISPAELWNFIKQPFVGLWNIFVIIFNTIVAGFQQFWERLKAGWIVFTNLAETVWGWIKGLFVGTIDVLSNVWEWVKTLFNGTIEVGKSVWDWFVGLFKGTISVATTVWEWFKGLFVGKNGSGSDRSVGDAIITPSGTVHTDPNDYIIATKKPGSLGGGGMTVNINIDKPMLTGQSDIKTLVKAIEQELYKTHKRYNSYA